MLATTAIIRAASRRWLPRASCRALATEIYKPTLQNRRGNEMGLGGRGSEAGLKVAIFGASGFLGPYVCTELGRLDCIVEWFLR
jgi:hypothetical protein